MQAILHAPVDLLWNGGIGTYVKAVDRVATPTSATRPTTRSGSTAGDLRAKVVGEGGNLGLTQRGRIEFALGGGRIFTDFIDNSAGVDCSDHEVNIKILLGGAVADGELTVPARDALLAEMTDEVAALVLRDNYEQATALGNARRAGPLAAAGAPADDHRAGAGRRSSTGSWRRLPTDEELAARRGRPG